MSEKRTLLITIDAGKVTCGECEHRDDYYCAVWGGNLNEDAEDVFLRRPECLAAEAKADELMLKTAMAKAAPQAI